MNRVLYEIGRIVWNRTQTSWGNVWRDGAKYTPLTLGSVKVSVESNEEAGSDYLSIAFDNECVSTWLDKREFYRAHVPDGWDYRGFVTWAARLFGELREADKRNAQPIFVDELQLKN